MDTFEGILREGHKEDAIEVPFDPGRAWAIQPQKVRPGRTGFLVRVEMNAFAFETVIVPRMKKFFILVPEDAKAAAGASAGDTVSVTVGPLAAPGVPDR